MGINTKALLNGKIDVMQLAADLISEYGTDRTSVKIGLTFLDDFFHIFFDHVRPSVYREMPYTEKMEWSRNNSRMMSVFYRCECDYADVTTEPMTYLSLGASGDAVAIMESLLKKYGGYIMRNDCSDDWEKYA
jgi:hypothetical protein